MRWWVVFLVLLSAAACHAEERTVEADVTQRVDDLQSLSSSLVPINDFVYKVEGEGAIFLINTDEGSVLVDTGFAGRMADQQALIREAATGPIRKIILTHAHIDHSGGITAWQPDFDAGAELVTHHRYDYMARLQQEPIEYFKRRNHVLYPTRVSLEPETGGPRPYWNLQEKEKREVYPGAPYEFELGGVKFVVIAPENGGEGEDGILLWLPESRILFTGDLFGTLYPMFPNLYTVRGEKYRDPLDYIDAMNLVLELNPKVIAHSHFRIVEGEDYIQSSVKQMRDAVQYTWDQTIQGMNEGRTVGELMEEIELPESLQLSQGHGKVSWGVRTIWEIVSGWYDYESVANLYGVPASAVDADLVELAGGPDVLAERAQRYLDRGQPLEALRLLDIARVEPTPSVLKTRIATVDQLIEQAQGLGNYSEIGLLRADQRSSRAQLDALSKKGEKGS